MEPPGKVTNFRIIFNVELVNYDPEILEMNILAQVIDFTIL